jgi:general secretion pathway protein J
MQQAASDGVANPGAKGGQTGFTLLEVLVVLVVLGLLVVGLTRGVRSGLAMWDAQTRRVGETSELDAAARILRTLLTGIAANPAGAVTPGAAGTTEFKGLPESVAFVGDLPDGLGSTRRAEIKIELRRERLVLSWTPRRHELSSAPPPEPVETELMRGVERIDVAYWGSSAPGQPPGWQPQWDGPAIPELIRLRLGFAKGDRRRWPDLIAAPQL